MRLVRGRPHEALYGIVGEYADFEQRTEGPYESGEAPGRGVVVIVDLDEGWTVEGERFGSFAGGLYARPVRVRHEGTSRGVQFDLEPPAVRRLFGIPAGELSERTISLEDVMGSDAHRLAERLHAAHDAPAKFAILDEVLRGLAARGDTPPPPDVEHAWALLRASRGTMRIEDLARRLGCSRRHLAKRFAEDIGASPKTAARLMRFESARRRLGDVPLARLAAEHGYADQAHLLREFRELGGAPPTAFPSVQDDGARAA